MFPRRPGAAHLHEFSGAMSTNAYSTVASLRRSRTTCDPSSDTAAYWQPALFLHGKRIEVDHTTAYFGVRKTDAAVRARVQPFPAGLRMITDLKHSTPRITGYPHAGWMCGSNQVKWGYPSSLTTIAFHCPDGLQVRIIFPDCWDGRNLDTVRLDGTRAVNPVTHRRYANDHRSHMAFTRSDGSCPRDHPVLVPRIDLKVNFKTKGLVDSVAHRPAHLTAISKVQPSTPLDPPKPNEGDSSADFTLAGGTGMAGAHMGSEYALSTFHADFYNAWDTKRQRHLVDYCIRQKRAVPDTPPCLHPTFTAAELAARANPNYPKPLPAAKEPSARRATVRTALRRWPLMQAQASRLMGLANRL